MGREVKRVALDFNWPQDKVWKGFINPFGEYSYNCETCDGSGYSHFAKKLQEAWKDDFYPENNGLKRHGRNNPVIRKFAERQVDNNPEYHIEGKIKYYGSNTLTQYKEPTTRDRAIEKEAQRLCDVCFNRWMYHLSDEEIEFINNDDRSLTRHKFVLLSGQDLEEFVRTRAYYLWLEAGCPEGDGIEFYTKADQEFKHAREGRLLPFPNGRRFTKEEIFEIVVFNSFSDISEYSIVKYHCEKAGESLVCSECNGHGSIWEPGMEEKYNSWEQIEPPEGEGYQIWETVSEGSPISPVFADPRDLAKWMVENDTSITSDTTYDGWLNFITGPGWAPSMIGTTGIGFQSGVAGLNNE